MPTYTAKTVDKHILYQEAVQAPKAEATFVDRLYRKIFGRPATIFREDFCGTSLICCEWVKMRRANQAYGVDLDLETLRWGGRHNVNALPPQAAARVRLIHGDVREVTQPKVQIIGAFNYSYFCLREIGDLVHYFRSARRSLEEQGLLVLDAYGGWAAQQVMQETTRNPRFTYVWDQADYDPVNDYTTCHIHFRFPDGTALRRAFTYHWRLWSLGAIQDALRAAGFTSTQVYWEGTNAKGGGNGVYRRVVKAENSAGWNACVVAVR
jgi:hypothetical protein